MNITEANAIARLLRGAEHQKDRDYLAHRAADTLRVTVQPGRPGPAHVSRIESDGFRVQPVCSCGWQGNRRWYRDAVGYAALKENYDLAVQDGREHAVAANQQDSVAPAASIVDHKASPRAVDREVSDRAADDGTPDGTHTGDIANNQQVSGGDRS